MTHNDFVIWLRGVRDALGASTPPSEVWALIRFELDRVGFPGKPPSPLQPPPPLQRSLNDVLREMERKQRQEDPNRIGQSYPQPKECLTSTNPTLSGLSIAAVDEQMDVVGPMSDGYPYDNRVQLKS